jgi:CRP-like cAMP-binding protein
MRVLTVGASLATRARSPIFDTKKFPMEVVVHLLYKLEPLVCVPGQRVLQQGKPNQSLFIIERGIVEVFKEGTDTGEERQKIKTLGTAQPPSALLFRHSSSPRHI